MDANEETAQRPSADEDISRGMDVDKTNEETAQRPSADDDISRCMNGDETHEETAQEDDIFELVDGYKPWEDDALESVGIMDKLRGSSKVPIGWLEQHDVPYASFSVASSLRMHQNGHPNVPPQRPVYTRVQLPFDYGLQSSFNKITAGFCTDLADLLTNILQLLKLMSNLQHHAVWTSPSTEDSNTCKKKSKTCSISRYKPSCTS
jgi:hypothetical protein